MKKKSNWTIGLVITVFSVVLYWISPPILNQFEHLYQNAHFQWRGPIQPGPEVVIVGIDEKSIDELGRWPWPRKTMSMLVEKLVARGVKTIGFDMVFSSKEENMIKQELEILSKEINVNNNPRIKSALNSLYLKTGGDDKLASVLEKSNRSVLGYFFHFRPEGLEHLSKKVLRDSFINIRKSKFNGFIESKGSIDLSSIDFQKAYAVEGNVSVLSEQTKSAGFFSFHPEQDGVIRKLPLIVRYHDENSGNDLFFLPLSLRILEKYFEGSFLFRVGKLGIEKVMLDIEEPFNILTDERGQLGINFLGKGGTFPHFSAADILFDRLSPDAEKNLRDKIIIIGATATALEDLKANPFDPAYPGVEIHATIIDNILRNNVLSQPPWISLVDVIYIIILGIFLTLVYSKVKPVLGIAVWLAVSFILFAFSHWIFIKEGFWISDFYPFAENTLIICSIMIFRFRTEEKKRQYIQSIFGKYLSPRVIKTLLADSGNLKLGGEQKELTALFSDLQGFSTFSESLSPKDLVNLLNTYLSAMTDILLKHEGTLDKYEGDAIIAFFGAPVFFDDHTRRACYVCIEMQEKLAEMRQKFLDEGKPELFMRVGLHTGFMVVGNMGSKARMNYTMMGDSVNLAARLEGVNKVYNTFSMISEVTYLKAKDYIEARELDTIRVVGRKQPVKIYELLGKAGFMDNISSEVLTLYSDGLDQYKLKNWDAAISSFKKALLIRPEDGPSSTMLERCTQFKVTAPPKDWDGVFSLESK
ncbi:MAG: CHASE2 domain-containing protein [Nitrospinales bacterium]